jgi:transmembrane 9 superfamily protein 3
MELDNMHVIGEDSGWKQVHGDVFRQPHNLVLFSAIIGTGWQLVVLIVLVLLYAIAGILIIIFTFLIFNFTYLLV